MHTFLEITSMYTLQELTFQFEKQFTRENTFNSKPRELYEAVEHIMSIKGKRIRPALLLMACDMFDGDVNMALNPAFGIEVFHNFTLVHDDIMDKADIRRGEPTVHKLYGLNRAILAGDVMLIYAYQYFSKVPTQYFHELVQVFSKAATEIMEGQQMDMNFEERINVTEEEYLKMIEYKTSVLLAAALQIGALIGGAGKRDQELLYQFGLNLGLSFQIKDDYLDTYGAGEKVGKKIGGDILQNKKTYLFITALRNADPEQRKKMLALLEETDEDLKISGILGLFDETNVPQITEAKIEELYRISIQSLDEVSVPEAKKQALRQLAEQVYNRDY